MIDVDRLEVIPQEGWLRTHGQFLTSGGNDSPWRMGRFYRYVRRETGILMEAGRPAGGKFSFDSENRLPWKGEPAAPNPPSFPVDPIKEEVGRLIQEKFRHHPGRLDLSAVPATTEDAEMLCYWAKRECLASFGPYEDAMSARSRSLFHTRISAFLNIGRLLPARVVADAMNADIPLSSKEGFVRQVLGWREFVHHVHVATDGS